VTPLLVAGCALLGLLIGSFLNVVIWRVPRGESIVSPPSHCPNCDQPVRPRDNIPVVSWLLLRGKCRDCGHPISARYPAVEAATAAVFGLLAGHFGPDSVLPAFLYLGAVGVALALIDYDTKRLPNVIVLPSYVVGLALIGVGAAVHKDGTGYLRALAGLAILYAFYFVLRFIYPAGMGFGDVKLAGVLGLYLGWLGWGQLVVGAFLGFLLGGVVGGGLMLARRAGRKSAVPFGPFMLAGALLAVYVGHPLAHAYVHHTVGS
jgi:leader peptidase (prepilin peptidase) / N-methyltransferase